MSTVQFNLLPDVKLEYNRAQQIKKVVYTISILAVGIVLILFSLSFLSVNVLQTKLLNDANSDINNYSQKLREIPELDRVLTIQNQLNSLPGLHEGKHFTSRLFTYLPQLTPTKASISKLTLDTSANTLSLTGTADSVQTVNKFVDTLKFTTYSVNDDDGAKRPAFSSVLLSNINRNDKVASYTIDITYNPVLFDAKQTPKLVVPKIITTRSVINAPGADTPIFDNQDDEPKQGGGQ